MPLTRGYNDEIKDLAAEPILGIAAEELFSTSLSRIAKQANIPLRLFASAVPDVYLNIEPNVVEVGDGAGVSSPPSDSTLSNYLGAKIDFQTGAIVGSGDVKTQGGTFTLPPSTATSGKYRRCFFVYNNTLNYVDTYFSPEVASIGALQNPGQMADIIEGQPLGYIDLEGTAISTPGAYKTAGSATNVIEHAVGGNKRIFRFGSGAGVGAGGDVSLKFGTIVGTNLPIKKGYYKIHDGKELHVASDLSYSLASISVDGSYYGYIDLSTLGAASLVNGRTVYSLSTSNIVFSTTIPEEHDLARYVPLGLVVRSGGVFTSSGTYATKTHPGYSGDYSFKFQSINSAGTELVIKNGSIGLSDGRELYAASDLVHDVSSIANSDGDWSGFIDLYSLGAYSIVDNRKVYTITTANFAYFKAYPEDVSVDLTRYIPCGSFDRTGGVYSGAISVPRRKYDIVLGSDASLVDALDFTLIGSVGDVGQLNSGHELAESSFPSTSIGANLSWYNLADMLDASGNARTLTNNGSATFGTGILGDASQAVSLNGSTQYLSSTDAFFDPGDADFTCMGWFYKSNWATGSETLFSQYNTSDNKRSYMVRVLSGILTLYGSTNGTGAEETSLDVSGLTGWNHIALKYDAALNKLTVFINGVNSLALTLSAGLVAAGATYRKFNIGSYNNGAEFFTGKVDEFVFTTATLTDNDIMKIQAAKYTHNKGLAPNAQGWEWWIKSAGGLTRPSESNPIVDIQPNELFFDLSVQEPTNLVSRKLFSRNQSGLAKPSKGQTLTLTTNQLDSLLPLSHGLGVVPELSFKVSDGTDYLGQDWGSVFKVDSTQIKIAGDSLVTLFGTGVNVILTYSSAIPIAFVPNRFWNVRRLSTTSAVSANDRVIADVTVSGFSLTLPPSPSIGDEVQLLDGKGAFTITNFVTFDRNGQPLRGGTVNFDCTQSNKLFRAIFVDEIYGWDILY